MFLHGGIFHLAANMYSLHFLGKSLEKHLNIFQYLNAYFLFGVVASLASCHLSLFSISVGASGAIFGLYAYQLLIEWDETRTERTSLIVNFLIFLVINLSLSNFSNIDHNAHWGGFTVGILFFLFLKFSIKPSFTLLLWILPVLSYFFIPDVQRPYFEAYQYMLQKDDHIRSALNSYYLDEQDQAEKIKVISTLPDSIKMKFDGLKNLPTELQRDTMVINDFFNQRNLQIYYFLKLLEENSYLYQDSILYIRDQLAASPRPNFQLNIQNSKNEHPNVSIGKDGLNQEREYYDENWDVTPYIYKAEFYRIGTKDSLGNWHGKIVDYYKDDRPQMKGTYFHELKHGIFIYYNDDGTYSSAGQYQNDKQVGKWEEYYSDNRLANEIRYVGTYSFIENIYDTLGNIMVKNGKGEEKTYYDNGQLRFKRTIEGGLNHGFKEGYYDDGKPYYREYHIEGILDYGISYDTLGNVYRYDADTQWPQPVGGFENLYQYFDIHNQLKIDSLDDYVHLKFEINKDGEIEEIRYLKRLRADLDQHAKDLLTNGPKWQPGRIRGFKKITKESQVYIHF